MKKQILISKIEKKGTRNYGGLTDISKTINELFGDKSGRTVSYRTAQGFKDTFKLDIDEETAEDIVHAGMITTGALLNSKDEGNNAAGLLVFFLLFGCYHAGK